MIEKILSQVRELRSRETPVREGAIDVAIVAAPRVALFPSVGVRELSQLCNQMGFSVGIYGQSDTSVKGVIPIPGTGGIVLLEDQQGRIHRMRARAIVKVVPPPDLPEPFEGWRLPGLIPMSTAAQLLAAFDRYSPVFWGKCVAILGSGNLALQTGAELLLRGISEVYCIESTPQWGAKRYSGWEVNRRKFEQLGGVLLEARPVQLIARSVQNWELRVQDRLGVRILEVGRVISVGPFFDGRSEEIGARQYPRGTGLFELEQTALAQAHENFDGWIKEKERGRWLAGKIVKALALDLGPEKERLDNLFKRAKWRLRRFDLHRQNSYTPSYQGKWLASSDLHFLRKFSGVPQQEQKQRKIASIECVEEIACNLCEKACPADAIHLGKIPRKLPVLEEQKCIGCSLCLAACPSQIPLMLQEGKDHEQSRVVLPDLTQVSWRKGQTVTLLNRKGEALGSGRVIDSQPIEGLPEEVRSHAKRWVEVEIPTHFLWEARGIRLKSSDQKEDPEFLRADLREKNPPRVELYIDGEKRWVRENQSISLALFETGRARSGDALLCKDGGCKLCEITVDGVTKLACQTPVHKGMSIKIPQQVESSHALLCECMGITWKTVREKVDSGLYSSVDAVLESLHLGKGKCQGQLCREALKRAVSIAGIQKSDWIDWSFPWTEWSVSKK